ncbi:MAG TPA: 4Fe-4S dicluster domain-containing protein [Thermoanaerobacterales bacterium]|nr:4Fe-4S dicluster domain-containing protein [Thermoanaerobacterales bacterium]
MSKILMISPDKCIGCRTCEIICSFKKIEAFNPKNSRVSVIAYDEAAISVPMMCMQCEEPSCMVVCPVSAIYKNEEGTVVIDENKCIGCKMCVSACPLGNITFSANDRKVVKCDLCDGDPQCAKFCPAEAIQFTEVSPTNLNRRKMIAERFKELFGEVEV